VKILRLTNSNDFYGDVADAERGYRIIEAALSAEFGEEVETIRRIIWPADNLPDLVERWVVEERPDIVFLKTSAFWYAYESVPLKLRRRFGRVGQAVGDSGLKAAATPRVAHNAVFRKLRYYAQATIGGEPHFTIDYCIENLEAVIRRVLRHEDTLLVVRGSRGGRERPDAPKNVAARHEARRIEFNTRLNALCEQLSIPMVRGNQRRKFDPSTRLSDQFHSNARGHAESGSFEAEALARIWREHSASPAPNRP
jgi:hypothetical protein